MSQYQLRIYDLKDADSLRFYKDEVYPRHLKSFPACDITPHGFWTNPQEPTKLYILVSFPDGADVDALDRAYRVSPGFLEDVRDMDLSKIVDVQGITLVPSPGSPLT